MNFQPFVLHDMKTKNRLLQLGQVLMGLKIGYEIFLLSALFSLTNDKVEFDKSQWLYKLCN